jgi:predicted esterase
MMAQNETQSNRSWRRPLAIARRVLVGLLATIAFLVLAPAALLCGMAETRTGRLFGLLGFACLGVVVAAQGWGWTGRAKARWVTLGVSAAAVVGLGLMILSVRAPDGTGGNVGLRSVVLGPSDRMRPGFLGRLPEIDAVKLMARLGTTFNPWMTSPHARRIREITLRLEREVEADPAGRTLPNVGDLALAELMGHPFDAGHYYAYVPPHDPDERLGMLVFLHGNGGNLKIKPWAWRPFADVHRFAIVAPTYGFGFWGKGGAEAVERAVADALLRLPIDESRVYLAGFSDGGNGVTRAGLLGDRRYRGLIYVSPTLRLDEVGSPAFADAWRGRPVLVLQGDADVNVRKADVDPAVDLMRAAGIDVTYRVFAGEDHFLFFGRSGEVFELVSEWMGRHP